jgi:hypothetical protein
MLSIRREKWWQYQDNEANREGGGVMLDFVFSWQFLTGLVVGANISLFVYGLLFGSKRANDKDFREWAKNIPR